MKTKFFFSKKVKGRLCVYREIVSYHLQFGLWGGDMGGENRPWTKGLIHFSIPSPFKGLAISVEFFFRLP